jgi:hypothetical protein
MLMLLHLANKLLTKVRNPPKTNYYEEFRNRRINLSVTTLDTYGIMRRYGVTEDDVINLAGGLPTNRFYRCEVDIYSTIDGAIKIIMAFDFGGGHQGRIQRSIFFDVKEIHNDEIQLSRKGNHIGTNVLVNQVNTARSFGFKKIKVHAAGGVGYPPPGYWEGYRKWIKYGYILDTYSHSKYMKWARYHNVKEPTLNHLYWNKKKYELWENYGFDWNGIFYLNDGSRSIKWFKQYFASKRINVLTLAPFADH